MTVYLVSILTAAGFFMLLALALNLQWGLTGMINFGIAGFYAIGAYASAIATETLGLPFTAGLGLAILLGTVAGLLVATLSIRLRGDFLAIVTLGFGEVVRLVILNEDWLTGGPRGFAVPTRPLAEIFDRQGYAWFYLSVILAAVLVLYLVVERIRAAPFGRVLRAIREDELIPATLGKNVLLFRLQAFAIGSAAMAAAGSLYAHYVQSISPDHFTTATSIVVWMSVIVGGAGNNRGLLLGAGAVMVLLEGTRFLGLAMPFLDAERLSALRLIIVGVLLILFLRFRPEGLLPERRPTASDLARDERLALLPQNPTRSTS